MKNLKSVDFSSVIRIKLNKNGRDFLENNKIAYKEDNLGYVSLPLWMISALFGSYLNPNSENFPFEEAVHWV